MRQAMDPAVWARRRTRRIHLFDRNRIDGVYLAQALTSGPFEPGMFYPVEDTRAIETHVVEMNRRPSRFVSHTPEPRWRIARCPR